MTQRVPANASRYEAANGKNNVAVTVHKDGFVELETRSGGFYCPMDMEHLALLYEALHVRMAMGKKKIDPVSWTGVPVQF